MATITMATHGASNDMTPMPESTWYTATIRGIKSETPTTKTFTFELPHEVRHKAGQHYEIRLTSQTGYQAARLYSAASAARGDSFLELTIALVPNGEITPYLVERAVLNEQVEIRGPLGRFFEWDPHDLHPLLLLGGGTGIIPMRCILQAHELTESLAALQIIYGARNYNDIIYKDELLHDPRVTIALSDSQPSNWSGVRGIITQDLLLQTLQKLPAHPLIFICGRTPFVEAMSQELLALGVPALSIKTERFGA